MQTDQAVMTEENEDPYKDLSTSRKFAIQTLIVISCVASGLGMLCMLTIRELSLVPLLLIGFGNLAPMIALPLRPKKDITTGSYASAIISLMVACIYLYFALMIIN
ncbi:hypothetical protein HOK15_03880 [Candidatus Falkowbacteria bacterium]|jgi:hypothetical protein|nr:hypothetical protein [Candidatus Falkowbacteria bacterium]